MSLVINKLVLSYYNSAFEILENLRKSLPPLWAIPRKRWVTEEPGCFIGDGGVRQSPIGWEGFKSSLESRESELELCVILWSRAFNILGYIAKEIMICNRFSQKLEGAPDIYEKSMKNYFLLVCLTTRICVWVPLNWLLLWSEHLIT